MDAKKLGHEPAYPVPPGCGFQHGLTKREAFALAAMQGSLSHPQQNGDPESVAMWAVKYADALLAELAKGE